MGQKLIKEQVAVGKAGKIPVVMTTCYMRRSLGNQCLESYSCYTNIGDVSKTSYLLKFILFADDTNVRWKGGGSKVNNKFTLHIRKRK